MQVLLRAVPALAKPPRCREAGRAWRRAVAREEACCLWSCERHLGVEWEALETWTRLCPTGESSNPSRQALAKVLVLIMAILSR
jgi:hypothetical protein